MRWLKLSSEQHLVCDIACSCGWTQIVEESDEPISQGGVAGEVAARHEANCKHAVECNEVYEKSPITFNWGWK